MKLILITGSKSVDDEAEIITRMFEEGLPTLHLRKHRWRTHETDLFIKKIPKHFHNRMVLHYHHILAAKYTLKGIHLSKEHLERKWKYRWLQFRLKLKFHSLSKSSSVYSLKRAYEIQSDNFNYVFIGNLFNNITGEFMNEYSRENISALIKSRSDLRWVARGGCTPSVIQKCKELGFYGIAFQSWVWNHQNPIERLKIIMKEFQNAGIEIK
ncbi:MAG: thiamine phosphate synthase [Bacteroidia bacterium]|nr:thiamine phosphate synthase [Bacteroidia bacterium]